MVKNFKSKSWLLLLNVSIIGLLYYRYSSLSPAFFWWILGGLMGIYLFSKEIRQKTLVANLLFMMFASILTLIKIPWYQNDITPGPFVWFANFVMVFTLWWALMEIMARALKYVPQRKKVPFVFLTVGSLFILVYPSLLALLVIMFFFEVLMLWYKYKEDLKQEFQENKKDIFLLLFIEISSVMVIVSHLLFQSTSILSTLLLIGSVIVISCSVVILIIILSIDLVLLLFDHNFLLGEYLLLQMLFIYEIDFIDRADKLVYVWDISLLIYFILFIVIYWFIINIYKKDIKISKIKK